MTGRSLVQGSPSKCGVSEGESETSKMGGLDTLGEFELRKKKHSCSSRQWRTSYWCNKSL